MVEGDFIKRYYRYMDRSKTGTMFKKLITELGSYKDAIHIVCIGFQC